MSYSCCCDIERERWLTLFFSFTHRSLLLPDGPCCELQYLGDRFRHLLITVASNADRSLLLQSGTNPINMP